MSYHRQSVKQTLHEAVKMKDLRDLWADDYHLLFQPRPKKQHVLRREPAFHFVFLEKKYHE